MPLKVVGAWLIERAGVLPRTGRIMPIQELAAIKRLLGSFAVGFSRLLRMDENITP